MSLDKSSKFMKLKSSCARMYLRFKEVSDCRPMMLSGMVLMQLWYRFSVSKATRWQTSVGTSASLFFDRSVERKETESKHYRMLAHTHTHTHRHHLKLDLKKGKTGKATKSFSVTQPVVFRKWSLAALIWSSRRIHWSRAQHKSLFYGFHKFGNDYSF